MKPLNIENVKSEIFPKFDTKGKVTDLCRYGNGHINDTFLVTTDFEGVIRRFILQRVNKEIFKKPDEVIENIVKVTDFFRAKLREAGEDYKRGAITVIKTVDGKGFYVDAEGDYWRMYIYIEDSLALDLPETQEDFYESARAFGGFQRMLSEYPAETLHETIVNFHNTPVRYQNFLKAIEENRSGRLENALKEVEFVKEREAFTHVLTDALKNGELPLRVTHNDTKMNNVLLDANTRKQLCVVDLDTIMPGLAAYDFGDSIRFGASTAAEDEKDLDKVHFDIDLFEVYVKGYLEGCGGQLTANEIEMLPEGAKMMTLECGMRFLSDYLDGDTYFRTHYPEHNLDRCHTQFKLVWEMEQKWDEMKKIVRAYK
ncbi:MAG: aminoglycoside phosphotransferase family protein [Oscillospiraceae bacterium]|nr:aminoglycoside phosphotransferase family protein [Oscillospiraceae bacterium]